ncbi:MAG TPA: ABC transporter ATP-binding protein [Streptosporangiaceae bacterium]|jgi:ABC-2 type transport system ATP-binding protein
MLNVKDLDFRYPGGSPVLHGASLQLEAGLVTGLLGANGSGKSTLLGAITNTIEGERRGLIEAAAEARGPIGYATQDTALYRHLTVAENLGHAARLATRRWRVTDLVSKAVDDFRLGHLAGRTARDLSGGQQRIVHLACAFVHGPTIRLLDEPTTALDFETRQILIDLVARWRGEGIATLVTAHYPEDVEELCSVITVLVEGKTYPLGSLREYLARQSRLGYAERLRGDGSVLSTELPGPIGSLAEIVRASGEAGIDPRQPLHAIEVRPPALRDLLRRDPSLRAAVEEELK